MGASGPASPDLLEKRMELARAFGEIAVVAGREILRIKARAPNIRSKADLSPVTDADERAEAIILEALEKLCPAIPMVAEESVAAGRRPQTAAEFLLVDPLDGTREFVAGFEEFTVNIALILDGSPVAGAVYAPATGELWCGVMGADATSRAWKCPVVDPAGAAEIGAARPIATRPFQPQLSVAVVSRAFDDARAADFVRACGVVAAVRSGSSIKFCRIAEGNADIYPRFGPTHEWDIAAGDAVLRAAGGIVLRHDGQPLSYGSPHFESPYFVAFGDRQAAHDLIERAGG